MRIPAPASNTTGLTETSRLTVDKVDNIPRTSLTRQVGRLSAKNMVRLDRALLVFLAG